MVRWDLGGGEGDVAPFLARELGRARQLSRRRGRLPVGLDRAEC